MSDEYHLAQGAPFRVRGEESATTTTYTRVPWDTQRVEQAAAGFAEAMAGLTPALADVLGSFGRLATDDSSAPDTSQPYFLDLIRRIDDVTEERQ